MSYVANNLQTNEQVIIEGKLHWIIFVLPVFFLLIGWLLYRSNGFWSHLGVAIMLFGLYKGLRNAIEYFTQEFVATNKRLIGKHGLIARDSLDLRLGRVESIRLTQDLLGRLLGYGTIQVGSAGSSDKFKHLTNALAFRSTVSQLLTDIEEQGYISAKQVTNQVDEGLSTASD